MSKPNFVADDYHIHIWPRWGTGWETVLNHLQQEITMQFKLFGLRLPLRRRIAYAEVKRVLHIERRGLGLGGEHMWLRYDTCVVTGDGRPVTIASFKPADTAPNLEGELKYRLNLDSAPEQYVSDF